MNLFLVPGLANPVKAAQMPYPLFWNPLEDEGSGLDLVLRTLDPAWS
jgi:hypothetical protein